MGNWQWAMGNKQLAASCMLWAKAIHNRQCVTSYGLCDASDVQWAIDNGQYVVGYVHFWQLKIDNLQWAMGNSEMDNVQFAICCGQ